MHHVLAYLLFVIEISKKIGFLKSIDFSQRINFSFLDTIDAQRATRAIIDMK